MQDPEQSTIRLNAIEGNLTVRFSQTAVNAMHLLENVSSPEFAAWGDEFADHVRGLHVQMSR